MYVTSIFGPIMTIFQVSLCAPQVLRRTYLVRIWGFGNFPYTKSKARSNYPNVVTDKCGTFLSLPRFLIRDIN